jgi:hypothetical protein
MVKVYYQVKISVGILLCLVSVPSVTKATFRHETLFCLESAHILADEVMVQLMDRCQKNLWYDHGPIYHLQSAYCSKPGKSHR